MNNFVLDDLGSVALEDLHLHGLVGNDQVAHRVLLLIVLGLLCLLLCDLLLCLLLCLLLQLVLLLRLLLCLLLCLLLGGLLLLLLLDQSILVGLLNNNQLLLGLSLLSLRLRLALTRSLVLLEMLALMQHEMVLLEEGLSALANVCSHSAASVWMASIVQQKAMFSRESFATVATIMGLGFRLGDHNRVLGLYLLDRLLNDLYLLLGLLVLDLLLCLLMLYLHLLLGRALWLQRLLYHLTGGCDYLYLINSREQVARNGSSKRAKIRHQALVAGVQT